VPQQENGYDCGIFVLEFLTHLLQHPESLAGLGLSQHWDWFEQAHVSHRRERLRSIAGRLQDEARKKGMLDVGQLMRNAELRREVAEALTDHPPPASPKRQLSNPGSPYEWGSGSRPANLGAALPLQTKAKPATPAYQTEVSFDVASASLGLPPPPKRPRDSAVTSCAYGAPPGPACEAHADRGHSEEQQRTSVRQSIGGVLVDPEVSLPTDVWPQLKGPPGSPHEGLLPRTPGTSPSLRPVLQPRAPGSSHALGPDLMLRGPQGCLEPRFCRPRGAQSLALVRRPAVVPPPLMMVKKPIVVAPLQPGLVPQSLAHQS